MDKKQKWKGYLPLIICAALFVGAFAANLLFGDTAQQTGNPVSGSSVVITEIMSNNRTYPDSTGRALDYIEIGNLTGLAVDISNYKLADDESTIGYTFPQGTVLPPYGYVVCWCDSKGGDAYAKFGISRGGGETIYLYNGANVVIHQKTVPALEANQPYIRKEDGSWVAGGQASPGFANTEEGNAQWLASIQYEAPAVVISEVQTTARHTWVDAQGTVCDWIELHNTGTAAAVLNGAYLSDDAEDPLKW